MLHKAGDAPVSMKLEMRESDSMASSYVLGRQASFTRTCEREPGGNWCVTSAMQRAAKGRDVCVMVRAMCLVCASE